MEIYRDLNLHHTGQEAGDGVFRGSDKAGIDKENEDAGVTSNSNHHQLREAGLRVRNHGDARDALHSRAHEAGNVAPSSERGPADAEQELKGRRRPELSQRSQRTVLEDVTHRYNSSSSESYTNSDGMAVDGEGVDEPEVVQPLNVAGGQRVNTSSRPSSPPTRARALKTRRVLDKSFTRRMR
jgi:hypothetical protein